MISFKKTVDRIRIAQRILAEHRPKWNTDSHQYFLKTCARRSLSLRGQRTLEHICATMAALEQSAAIEKEHLDEALLLHVSNAW